MWGDLLGRDPPFLGSIPCCVRTGVLHVNYLFVQYELIPFIETGYHSAYYYSVLN